MNRTFDDLEKQKLETINCTMCGYCKAVCPVFIDVGWDSASPRGRMILAYGLLTGEIEPDLSIADRLFQCTNCTDCMRRCPSNAKCPDVVRAARREMVKLGFVRPAQKMLVDNIETTGNIFADPELNLPEQDGPNLLFIGCQHLSRPNATKKTIRLLDRIGIQVGIMQEVCCGFPLEIMGFTDAHAEQKKRFEDRFKSDSRPVITLCPSCLVHLQHHYQPSASHILQEIDRRLDSIPLTPQTGKVTYHDPCDLSRGAKIIDEPRRILKKMGYDLVEMTNSGNQSRCCGGGGGILTWDAEIADHLSKRRIEEAVATGADMVVTACATCEQTLKKGTRMYAEASGTQPIPVRHLLDLLSKAIA